MAETQASNLAEYKAGRMVLLGTIVEPDERKGLLFVRRTDDNHVHIHWMDRRSGIVELDVVAMPGDVEFRRIDQCKTGRVYVLKYTRSTDRFYFWMQEPQADGDAAFCKRVNELIASGERIWDENAAAEGDVDTDVETKQPRLFGGNEKSQLLGKILGGMQENWHTDDAVEAKPPLPFMDPYIFTALLDMGSALRIYGVEAVENLISCPLRRERLLAQLPNDPDAGDRNEEIRVHLHSAQFYETMAELYFGLHSGVLRPILKPMFQDGPRGALDAAQGGDIERFLRELQNNHGDDSGPTD